MRPFFRGVEEFVPRSPPPRAARARFVDARNRRCGWMVLLIAVALLTAPTSALAGPSPSTTSPESAKQQNANRKKQVGAELDAANASEDELHQELDRLDGRVKAEDERAKAAEAEQGKQLEAVAAVQVEVNAASAEVDLARRFAAERAVLAYMRPDRETASQVLAAKDPQAFGKMHALVREVAEYNHDVMQQKEIAETFLRQKKAQVDEAQRKADDAAAQAKASYDAATQAKDQRTKVRDELSRRINDLKNEQSALDAQEGQLAAIIAARQAQVVKDPSLAATPAPSSTTRAPVTTAPPSNVNNPTPTTRPVVAAPPTTVRPPSANVGLIWPVSGVITSGFGMRDGRLHQGIDIGVPTGTPIRAAAAGVVFFSGEMDGYGNVILIDHGNGMVTLYAHQSQLGAIQGARVSQGQVIGYAGSTGHSTGPHVHFEVRVNGTPTNPLAYLP